MTEKELRDEVRDIAQSFGHSLVITEVSARVIVDVGRHSWINHGGQSYEDFWQEVLKDMREWKQR